MNKSRSDEIQSSFIYRNLPSILDSRGNAELRITTNAPFTINCDSEVFRRCGRIDCMNGIVYSPTADVAAKYKIINTSIAAPIGPSFDNDVMPNVNFCRKKKFEKLNRFAEKKWLSSFRYVPFEC